MSDVDDLVLAVRDALQTGELGAADLTARTLGRYLGKTTSVLYHHFGSLDGFLFAVSQSGYRVLGARLIEAAKHGGLVGIAEGYVALGLEAPALYAVMFERRYDWDALRERGVLDGDMPGLEMWAALISFLAGTGSRDPETDARIFFAALHGLVSLALSGRANVGDTTQTDWQMAMTSARRLAWKFQETTRHEHLAAPAAPLG